MPITIASILNLMGPHMMVILLVVLLLFGAKKLPQLARGLGRAVREFSAARDEVKQAGRPPCRNPYAAIRFRDLNYPNPARGRISPRISAYEIEESTVTRKIESAAHGYVVLE